MSGRVHARARRTKSSTGPPRAPRAFGPASDPEVAARFRAAARAKQAERPKRAKRPKAAAKTKAYVAKGAGADKGAKAQCTKTIKVQQGPASQGRVDQTSTQPALGAEGLSGQGHKGTVTIPRRQGPDRRHRLGQPR